MSNVQITYVNPQVHAPLESDFNNPPSPRGLAEKAEVFKKHLQELEEDLHEL